LEKEEGGMSDDLLTVKREFVGDLPDDQMIWVSAGELRAALARVVDWNRFAEFPPSVLLSLSLSCMKVNE
jgi:hypothetical protein